MANLFQTPLLQGYPLVYKFHAFICLFLGSLMTFRPSLVLRNPLWIRLHSLLGLAYIPPATTNSSSNGPLSSVEIKQWSNVGILLAAIGIINILITMKPGGWALARKFIRVRILAAFYVGMIWVFVPESRDLVKALLILDDGVGGLLANWQMGP